MVSFLQSNLNIASEHSDDIVQKINPYNQAFLNMGCPLNLLTEKNVQKLLKKKKKSEKIVLLPDKNDTYKIDMPENWKNDLIQWLKGQSNDQLFQLLSIQDQSLSMKIIKMFWRYYYYDENTFALLHDSSQNNIFDDIDKQFYCRKEAPNYYINEQKRKYIQAEKEIIENLIVFDQSDSFDTIGFNQQFLSKID